MKKVLLFLALLATALANAQSTITLTTPNGGEVWNTSTTQSIKWTYQSVSSVDIDYTTDNGLTWTNIVTDQPSTGTYSWLVTASPSLTARIRIANHANTNISDISDSVFIIGPILYLDAGPDITICSGESVPLFATTITYTNDGNSFSPPPPPNPPTFVWSPATGLSDPNIQNPVASPTVSTTYTITADDGQGNTAVDTIRINVNQSPVLFNVTGGTHCNSASISLSGSQVGIAYQLIRDANTNVGSALSGTGSSLAFGSQSIAGVYTIKASDGANGCAVLMNGSAQVSILRVTAGLDTAVCEGSSVVLGGTPDFMGQTASGGVEPYTYNWSPALDLDCSNCANPLLISNTNSTHSVTVTDAIGCSAVTSVNVNVTPGPGLSLRATHPIANVRVQDTIYASVAIGQNVNYEWSLNYIGNSNFNESYRVYNFPGVFHCTAINSFGCSQTDSITINGELTVTVDSFRNVSCNGSKDGYIHVTVSGSTPPYGVRWILPTEDTTSALDNLPWGIYSVIAVDGDGKTGFAIQQITEPEPMQVSILNTGDGQYPDTLYAISPSGVSYSWTPPSTTIASNGLIIDRGGIYNCLVTDGHGCMKLASDTIGLVAFDDHFDVVMNHPAVLRVLDNDAAASTWTSYPQIKSTTAPAHGSVTAGTGNGPAITYTPNTNFIGGDSFTYITCLGDSGLVHQSYCDTAVVYLTVRDTLLVNVLSITPVTCSNNCNGIIQIEAVGGTLPISYVWSNGDTTQNKSSACVGHYSVTITDNTGRKATADVNVPSNIPSVSMVITGDTLWASLGNNTPTIYTWSTGDRDTSAFGSAINTTISGSYCVTATDINDDCPVSTCVIVGCPDCVWPGDADNSTVADNNDLLPIGLGYGKTGAARINASIDWQGQPGTDWPDVMPDGNNYKHADCNGDGIINADDTLAIMRNYGLTHSRGGGRKDPKEGKPILTVKLSPDTVHAGDLMTATITLGTASIPAVDVYGLAFTLNYDKDVVDTSATTVHIGDSWLGNNSDRISIAKDLKNGKIQLALTRIDHTMRSGQGVIAVASFIITTDNINGKNLSYHRSESWISDVKAIDNQGNSLEINEGADTASVEYTPTGINEVGNTDLNVSVYPNPANGVLNIVSLDKAAINEIVISGLLGDVVLRQQAQAYRSELNVSQLSPGTYFVEVKTTNGIVKKRIVIAR